MTESNTPPKVTPFYDWHLTQGAKMVDFEGWLMPIQYSDGIIQEHLAVRRSGGLFDVSHMGRFRIQGRDKIAFMQHVLTNNCQALEPWEAQYTIIQDEAGGAIDDAFLYLFGEDDFLLVVNASNAPKDYAHFMDQAARFDDVKIIDQTGDLAMIAFQGPESKGIIESLKDDGVMPDPRQGALSEISLAGMDVLIARTGYTGEPNSFELFPPADRAVELMEVLYAAGKPLGVAPAGLGARDTLRLEAGMPLYGHELGLDHDGTPIPVFAIGLAPLAVSFSELKGDFIGRTALENQFRDLQNIRNGKTTDLAHLPKRIMPLALEDKGVARAGYEVCQGTRLVGRVTSGTSAPYWVLDGCGAGVTITDEHKLRPLSLAYLDSAIVADTELEIQVRKKRLRARVVKFHGRSEAPPYFHSLPVGWERPCRESPVGLGRAKMADLIGKALDNHAWRQEQCINLIPSEQTTSPLVRMLSVTDPANRYAEHKGMYAAFLQEVYYYQGCEFICWVEDRLAAEMAEFLGCDLVEVRPVSGQMANMTLFSALVAWKNRTNTKTEPARLSQALTNHIGRGGHLSAQPMGALRDYIAKDPRTEKFAVINFPIREDNPFEIDLEETAKLLDENDPELIVLGKSMVLHREPVAEVARMIAHKKVKPWLMYDMAHVLGLIGPHFQQPFLEGADFVTGSTHKTFFGTQRGVIGGAGWEENTPEYELWEGVQRRAFPGAVSNHHLGTLLGLLASAIEMNAFKDDYQPQVTVNAKAFARALKDEGLDVLGRADIDFTETHQVILGVGYSKGVEAAKLLEENNIICNYQAVPSDEGFSAASALRLGVQEMTRFGMKEQDFRELAGLMADVLLRGKSVKAEAAKLRSRFLEMNYCFNDLGELEDRLKGVF